MHGRWHGEKFLGPTRACDDLKIRRKALSAEELSRREGRKPLLAKARSYGFRLPGDPAMALLQVGLQLGLGPAELKLLFPDPESVKNWHSKFLAIQAGENSVRFRRDGRNDLSRAPFEQDVSQRLQKIGYAVGPRSIAVPWGADLLWKMPGHEQDVERLAAARRR